MNWLTDFVRPKIRTLLSKRDVPEDLWHKCPGCEQMIFHRELERNLSVCPHCGHHMRLSALKRMAAIFDEGPNGETGGTRIELPAVTQDPLKFRDRRRYTERLKEAQAETTLADACVVAHGTIGGHRAVIAAFEFSFMAGSMGMAVGEAIVAAAKLAELQEAALIVFPSSGGARMQEGALSLMQMPRTSIAVLRLKQLRLPYIVVLTDPTTGGVSASFAMLGDIHISEPGALIGFAGQRVIEQTVREKLPDGFQRAEYLLEHGMVDMVVRRGELPETLARLLALLSGAPLPLPAEPPAEDFATPPEAIPAMAGEEVQPPLSPSVATPPPVPVSAPPAAVTAAAPPAG
jgi:acetyl-CoA carboxylase carboxyl transferase subunit beta